MADKGGAGGDTLVGGDEATEATWATDEVDRIIVESLDAVLLEQIYHDSLVDQWVNMVCEMIIGKLNDTKKPFKWVVSCLIMQKNGAGVHCSHSAHWDTASDGMLTVIWPKDKAKEGNKTIQAVVTVLGTDL